MKGNTFSMKILILLALCLFASYSHATPIEDGGYKEEILDFYSVNDPFGEFSNFADYPIVIDELSWPTSEHYYQAHKYTDPILMEKVRAAKSPMEAALLGRDPNIPKRPDWDEYKDIAMEVAVRAKFDQHARLKELLKSTNNSSIFEHTKNDCYWGDCGDRTGKNKLGKLLMKLRSEYN
jgi:ribA/ribD-fused uncharacterized protein